MDSLVKVLRPVATSVGALGAVVLFTWLDRLLHFNGATAAFTFLLIVLGVAVLVGLRESILASFAGMLAYNYFFLPPLGTFTIADPQNWVALFVFLATAVTVSQLSSSARRRAEEANAREQELGQMYEFSRALVLGDSDRSLIAHILNQLAKTFRFGDVSFYETATDKVFQNDETESRRLKPLLRRVAAAGEITPDEKGLLVPVRLGGSNLGSMAVVASDMPSRVALQAVAQLVGIALERARAQQVAGRLEATRQNEQLKSTLLDALAHEFKTPLTSVKAATTTLLSRPVTDAVQSELLTVIDEEADRMNNLVNDSLQLARIGSGPVTLHREVCSAEALLLSAIEELRPLLEGRDLQVQVEPSLPLVDVDSKLCGLALRQLLSNALKYSPPDTPVQVSVHQLNDRFVKVSVANQGPEIPKAEQALLFEKFYRGSAARQRVPGTGMGLSIAREIVETQGGRIWVESESGKNVEFLLTLPIGAPQLVV